MRGILKAHGSTDRTVWVADSFEGFPTTEAQGASARSFSSPEMTAVRGYGLLDDQVQFLPGWFRDTLPSAPIERLAVLRLDGDLYDSTYDALDALYPRLSPGGYAIVDDYGIFEECRQAVHDYLATSGTEADPQRIDDEAVFWQKRR